MPKKKKVTIEEEKPPEFRFHVSKFIDERTQKEKLLFSLQTTRVFRSFRYNILVKEKRVENSFHFSIEGLSMSSLTIPENGSACYEKEYPMVKGECKITVLNLNKDKSIFTLKFTPKAIKILQQPTEPFIEVSVE